MTAIAKYVNLFLLSFYNFSITLIFIKGVFRRRNHLQQPKNQKVNLSRIIASLNSLLPSFWFTGRKFSFKLKLNSSTMSPFFVLKMYKLHPILNTFMILYMRSNYSSKYATLYFLFVQTFSKLSIFKYPNNNLSILFLLQ